MALPQVPSNWALQNSPILVATTQSFRYAQNDVALFGAATTVAATAANSVPQSMTITKTFHDDVAARILTLSWDPDSATARTLTVRITGTGHYGQPITEDVAIAQASGTIFSYFTRNAFKTVTSAVIVSTTAASGGDTLSLGIVALAGTLAGAAGTQINGASATHYKGFALALPPKNGLTAAAPVAATAEVTGITTAETAAAASTVVVLNRGAGFLIDAVFAVMVPQETFVLTGDGIRTVELHIQTNRGE